jgi:hypothetical protein
MNPKGSDEFCSRQTGGRFRCGGAPFQSNTFQSNTFLGNTFLGNTMGHCTVGGRTRAIIRGFELDISTLGP